MKHLKTPKQLNEASENLNMSDVSESKIFTDGISTLKVLKDDESVILHLKNKNGNINNFFINKDNLQEFINYLNEYL